MAGIDSNTLLILHGDDLTDSSSNAVAITNNGVTVSTTQSKFGGKSLYFNGSSYLTLQNLNLIPKSGDFTVDWWEYRTASTTGGAILHQNVTDDSGYGFLLGYGSQNYVYISSSQATNSAAWDIANGKSMGAETLNQWVHYAIVRTGSTFLLFRNGVLYSQFTSNLTIITLNAYPDIGRYTYNGSKTYFAGYIDEFRISNIARWTADFEVPTEAYSGAPKLSHTFSRLLNNVIYYGKVFVMNPKGRINLRCDLASVFATPVGGIKIETLPIGSEVKIPVNGVDYNFIVVNQGNPDSSLYDSSCDGTWLLMKDVYGTTIWDSSNNKLAESDIHTYLNNDFISLLDTNVQDIIKEIKIPYYEGGGYGLTTHTGADGLSTQVFLLSPYEMGAAAQDHLPIDGAALDYFDGINSSGANNKRQAYYNGSIANYWTRTAHGYYGNKIWFVDSTGRTIQYDSCNIASSYYTRPAFILPSDTECELEPNADGSYNLKTTLPSAAHISPTNGVTYTSGLAGLDAETVNLFGQAISNNSDITNETSVVYVDFGGIHREISVGDQVTLTLNGTDYAFDIIGFNHDNLTNSNAYGEATATGKAGFTFQMHGIFGTSYMMNGSSTNTGGWQSSTMRVSTMATMKNYLPSAWKSIVKPVNKATGTGNNSTSGTVTTSDSCFLLSEIEIFGTAYYAVSGEGSQYAYYKAGNSKNKSTYWWTRSPKAGYIYGFCYVYKGATNYNTAANNLGVAFAFCV